MSGTAAEVLASNGTVPKEIAKREAARAEAVAAVPGLQEAFVAGEVAAGHLDVIARKTRGLKPDEAPFLNTDRLLQKAKASSPDQFERAAKYEIDKARNDFGLSQAIEDRDRSTLKMWINRQTGMGEIHATLDLERYDIVRGILNREVSSLAVNAKATYGAAGGKPHPEETTVKAPTFKATADKTTAAAAAKVEAVTKDEHLAADALLGLLDRCNAGASGVSRPLVTLVVDSVTAIDGAHEHSLRETSYGSELPPESIKRHLCDAVIQPVMTSDGMKLKVGRASRTATTAQWTAIKALYRSCGWDGCEAPVDHCQAHHIQFWENSPGLGVVSEAINLC